MLLDFTSECASDKSVSFPVPLALFRPAFFVCDLENISQLSARLFFIAKGKAVLTDSSGLSSSEAHHPVMCVISLVRQVLICGFTSGIGEVLLLLLQSVWKLRNQITGLVLCRVLRIEARFENWSLIYSDLIIFNLSLRVCVLESASNPYLPSPLNSYSISGTQFTFAVLQLSPL